MIIQRMSSLKTSLVLHITDIYRPYFPIQLMPSCPCSQHSDQEEKGKMKMYLFIKASNANAQTKEKNKKPRKMD